VPERENIALLLAQGSVRMLMGIKNVSGSYAQTSGTLMPGYKPSTQYMGMEDYNGVFAPGIPFIIGWQDPDFAWNAVRNQWLTTDSTLNAPYVLTKNENLTIRSTIEPIPSFRIELNGTRNKSTNKNEYYIADGFGNFNAYNPLTNGNFTISVITLKSAFEKSNADNGYSSETFEQFRKNREVIAKRLADQRTYDHASQYIPRIPNA